MFTCIYFEARPSGFSPPLSVDRISFESFKAPVIHSIGTFVNLAIDSVANKILVFTNLKEIQGQELEKVYNVLSGFLNVVERAFQVTNGKGRGNDLFSFPYANPFKYRHF